MGFFSNFLNSMKLRQDDLYDDEYDEPNVPNLPKPDPTTIKEDSESGGTTKDIRPKTPKVTPIGRGKGKQGLSMEVCVIKPSSFEDSKEITVTLLTNRAVVLNLEAIDLTVAQRIIDFASGSCYAIGGNLQMISKYIFIVTPPDVNISGDLMNILDSIDFSGTTL